MIMGMTSLVLHDGAMVKLLGGGPHCGWLMSPRWGRAGGRHPVRSVNNLDWQDADVDVLMLMLVLLFFCCCCTQLNAIGLYSLNGIGLNDLNVCLVWMLQFQLSNVFANDSSQRRSIPFEKNWCTASHRKSLLFSFGYFVRPLKRIKHRRERELNGE